MHTQDSSAGKVVLLPKAVASEHGPCLNTDFKVKMRTERRKHNVQQCNVHCRYLLSAKKKKTADIGTSLYPPFVCEAPRVTAARLSPAALCKADSSFHSAIPPTTPISPKQITVLSASMLLNTLKPVCCQRAQVSAQSAVESNPAVLNLLGSTTVYF